MTVTFCREKYGPRTANAEGRCSVDMHLSVRDGGGYRTSAFGTFSRRLTEDDENSSCSVTAIGESESPDGPASLI